MHCLEIHYSTHGKGAASAQNVKIKVKSGQRSDMQLREAKIFSFGKLQNKEYTFAPGINVIYGANEAGKSTLHAFLLGMLFGMEKSRGRGAKEDYARYEPWHAPAYYSGALRFEVGGRPFYLERNFYHREKRELLRNEADGEELSVAYGDLAVLLGGIGKEIYGNTYDIPQSGAAAGRELSGMLTEYLTNVKEGGNGEVHVTRALELLHTKKKELNVELRNLQEKNEQEKRTLETEQMLLEQDIARLNSEIEAERREWEKVQEKRQEAAQTEPPDSAKKRSRQDRKGRSMLVSAVVCAVICAVSVFLGRIFGGDNTGIETGFLLAAGALGGAAVVLLAAALRARKHGNDGRQRDTGRFDDRKQRADAVDVQAEMADAQAKAADLQIRRMMERQQEALTEKEIRLYNIREKMENLKMSGAREREIASDLKALALASDEITRLAGECGEELTDMLSSEVSRYVSAITNGKYDSVRLDEKGGLLVQTEGKEVSPDALSRGTLEQFYLAFRLAVGNIVAGEETMPVLLDETFAMYDDVRLAQTLRMLAKLPNQILIFTCRKRETEKLSELKIPYHFIRMDNE